MYFLTFASAASHHLGVVASPGQVLDLTESWPPGNDGLPAPTEVSGLIHLGKAGLQHARSVLERHIGDADRLRPLAALQVLAPIPHPSKNVFCIGRHYREHIIEGNRARGRAADDFPPGLGRAA